MTLKRACIVAPARKEVVKSGVAEHRSAKCGEIREIAGDVRDGSSRESYRAGAHGIS